MSAVFLNWRTVTHSQSSQFLVRGAILSRAICGPRHRFAVEEVRAYDIDGNADRRYVVRDAESISDHDLREGKPMPIVFRCLNLDELDAFLEAAE